MLKNTPHARQALKDGQTSTARTRLLDEKYGALAAKEIRRLRATIAKLTGRMGQSKPKQVYLDEVRLAVRWGVSVKKVRTLRYGGGGPEITYFGRSVRYRMRDILAYERSITFANRSDRDVRGR